MFGVFRWELTGFESDARHAYEEGDHCRALKTWQMLRHFSRESRHFLAKAHAGGFCMQQDIPRAREIYDSIDDDFADTNRRLFYDALSVAEFDDLSNAPRRAREISALFKDANRNGYRPSEKDLDMLSKENLTDIYEAAVATAAH